MNSSRPTRPSPAATQILSLLLVALACIPIAQGLVVSQLTNTNIFCCREWGLAAYLDGTVNQPYAYRVLTIWLVRLVHKLRITEIGIPGIDAIADGKYSLMLAMPLVLHGALKAYVIVAVGFADLFLVATFACATRLFRSWLWGIVALLLATISVNALMLQQSSHIYDFTVLFFATILFMVACDQRDKLFLAIFFLACLTKESLALFIPVFALIGFNERPLRQVAVNAVAQTAMFALVYGTERVVFAGNGGAPMYSRLDHHIRYIREHCDLASVLCLLVFLVLLLYRLPEKPVALRRSMAVIPVLLLLYVLGGNAGEFRVAYDMFPIILLPIVDSLRRFITVPANTKPH